MTDSPSAPLDDAFKRNILALATILARMPANVREQPFRGPLAVMELVRVIRSVHGLEARLWLADGQSQFPVEHLTAATADHTLQINQHPWTMHWVVFHKSALPAFDHILCCANQQQIWLLAAERSPLLEESGQRLLRKHAAAMAADKNAIACFLRELEGVAGILLAGGPFAQRAEEGDDDETA